MIQKKSIGDIQSLSKSFVVQIREIKPSLLPCCLYPSIIKIVVTILNLWQIVYGVT